MNVICIGIEMSTTNIHILLKLGSHMRSEINIAISSYVALIAKSLENHHKSEFSHDTQQIAIASQRQQHHHLAAYELLN